MSTENLVQDTRHDRAAAIISSAVAWSAAAGAVPLPLIDMVAVGAVQAKMVVDLSNLYGESASKEAARGLVSVLLGTLVPAGVTGSLLGSGSKLVPVAALVGMASMAAFSAAATYAIGKVFVRHFEKGGTLNDFSADAVKEEFKQDFADAKSRKVAGSPA